MEAPKLPTIFKQNRSKGFDYQPLYYSEAKERKEELERKISGEAKNISSESFKSQFRAELGLNKNAPQSKSSNLRLYVIIAILFLISYLILMY